MSKSSQTTKTNGTATAAKTETEKLSNKDQSALKNVSKLFDDRKYKKALKEADAFLKIHPTNVDCQCFRILTIYALGRKEEAHDTAKKVIRSNLSSFTAWHSLGYLHRQDKNYAEALKCFKTAHRNNKESIQILKDLSSAQVYQRDLPGLLESYQSLLNLQPANKSNWIGIILTNHLLKNYEQALKILGIFTDEVLEDKDKDGLRYSELLQYKAMLLEESGETDKVISLLRMEDKKILDKLWSKLKIGQILNKKNDSEGAEKQFRELLNINSENTAYHSGLWKSKQIDSLVNLNQDQIQTLSKLYQELAQQYPKSFAIQKFQLSFLPASNDEFKEILNKFTKLFLNKGIPSLFNNLKSLYNDKSKVDCIEKLFNNHLESMTTKGTLHGFDEKEPPSTLLWTHYFLALHYDRIKNYSKAMEQLELAIKHTPTTVDLYVARAKIMKHQGNLRGASDDYELARKMDLADRYLNTKSALYALRCDDRDLAQSIFKTVIDKNDTLYTNISEFQCMWYEKELGRSYLRTNELPLALKYLTLVDRHFGEFIEDQFDFYNHIQKKLTLRAYVDFLRWEDNVYKNKPYLEAAKSLIKTYLILLKKPFVKSPETEVKEVKPIEIPLPKEGSEVEVKVDDDPYGEKLASVPNVLVPAKKFLKTMLKFTPDSIDAHLLACQVYSEQNKYHKVVQSLLKLQTTVPSNPLYHRELVSFVLRYQNDKVTEIKDEKKKQIITEGLTTLLGAGVSLETYNEQYITKPFTTENAMNRFVAGEALLRINSVANKDRATKLMTDLSGNVELNDCRENIVHLQTLFENTQADLINQYKEQCRIKFPIADCFDNNKPTETTTTTSTTSTTENGQK